MNDTILKLIERAREGDREAFDDIARRYWRMVKGMTRALGHDAASGDDLVQEIFLKAWRSLPDLREPSRFLPWLQALTRNVCRSDWRSWSRRPQIVPLEERAVVTEPVRTQGLEELLEGVPPKTRQVMKAKFEEGRSYREIADVLKMNLSEVRKEMELGLRIVSRSLKDDMDWSGSAEVMS